MIMWIVLVQLLLLTFCGTWHTDALDPSLSQVEDMLRRGTQTRPPIIVLPGLMSTRLIAWKNKRCRGPDINVQDVVWLNLQKLLETMTYDKNCWLECVKLGPNGTDPEECKLRPDEGLSAIGELSPGNIYTPASTSVFTNMVKYLSNLGYDVNGIIGLPYDWRLSPGQLEERDSFFSSVRYKLETAVKRHKRPAIILAHSMGNNLFMYFCEWMKHRVKPIGGHEKWFKAHIWAYVGFAAPLLGAPGSIKGVLSGHPLGLSLSQAQARDMTLTFTSSHMVNPRSLPKGSSGSSMSSHYTLSSQSFLSSSSSGPQASPSTSPSSSNSPPLSTSAPDSHYIDPIVSFKSLSGSSNISFGIKDVENGRIFSMIGNLCRDPKLVAKYTTLHDLYLKDPLKPLGNFDRPPIKHVMMVYGVDMPSEIGYSYLIPEGKVSDTISALDPILDEVYMEEPCENELQVGSSDNNDNHDSKNGNSKIVNYDDTLDMRTSEIDINENVAIKDLTGEIEPLQRQPGNEILADNFEKQPLHDIEDDVDDPLSAKPSSFERPLTTTSWDGETITEPEVVDDVAHDATSSFSILQFTESLTNTLSVLCTLVKENFITGASTLFHHGSTSSSGGNDVEVNEQCNDSQSLNKGNNNALIESVHGDNEKIDRDDAMDKKDCKSYIYAVKNKDPYQKVGSMKLTDAEKAMLRSGKDKKRFVRRGTQQRTGDFTIPYISLSFAHTWLSEPIDKDYRPGVVHKVWGDGKRGGAAAAVGMGVTVDPSVTIFSSAPSKSGETTAVIEVERVDHLDIVKHPYVHSLVFENLLSLMAKEFHLEE